jgi:three-Cys-motif partner protein
MLDHSFGGPWTEIKLGAVEYYLQCYTRALKRVGFDLTYIDAFAGTGFRNVTREVGGIFEGGPIVTIDEILAGSAQRALAVEPPFDHFRFIEKEPERCQALDRLREHHPSKDISVLPGEANQILRDLVKREPWIKKDTTKSRGVVFLDPYALHVDWITLQALAATQVLDIWYLFPIRDTIRQLAHNFEGVGPKETMLDRVLGPEWRELYSIVPETEANRDLFDEPAELKIRRVVSVRQFEQWLKGRLEGEFRFVSQPLPILTAPSRQVFSLFLGVSNPSEAAIELAKKFVRYVNKHFAPGASRRKSGRETPGP